MRSKRCRPCLIQRIHECLTRHLAYVRQTKRWMGDIMEEGYGRGRVSKIGKGVGEVCEQVYERIHGGGEGERLGGFPLQVCQRDLSR